MGENGQDFLDVMSDEHKRRRGRAAAESFQKLEKMFARGGVEARAGFVENQEARAGHEGAADEDALAFALRKIEPGAFGEMGAFNLAQQAQTARAIGAGDAAPEINHRVASTDDGFQSRLVIGHQLADGGADEADVFAKFTPIRFAEALAEHGDFAVSGHEITGEGAEEGSLAGAVRAKDDPMLTGGDAPVKVAENAGAAAPDGEAGDFQDR